MYESYYGFHAQPFQLRPDPDFLYGSKGHKRALAYLDYGLARGEGFIVVTGEVGAGKTTLLRHLLRTLPSDKIYAAQIATTQLDADDLLRMVAAAFELPYDGLSKAALLSNIGQLLQHLDRQGKRALLVIDEAQNLSARAVEELRMLSNFQTCDRALLQTFLLGQPEFRKTLMSPGMEQLRQRVTATFHLGPMEEAETRRYIEHRLATVGWSGRPSIDAAGFAAIHAASGGVPRRINTLCDRLLLMGYLEEIDQFGAAHVQTVVDDLAHEFAVPQEAGGTAAAAPADSAALDGMEARIAGIERSILSMLDAMKSLVGQRNSQREHP